MFFVVTVHQILIELLLFLNSLYFVQTVFLLQFSVDLVETFWPVRP